MSLRRHSLPEDAPGGCYQNEAASLLGVACVLGVASFPWEVQLVAGVSLVVSSSAVCAPEAASLPWVACQMGLVACVGGAALSPLGG